MEIFESMAAKNKTSPPDIKYLGIPNICFSLTDKKDKREVEFKKQRTTRGFDESETWSLMGTICKFILPRLKEFIDCHSNFPAELPNIDTWNVILDKIVVSLELLVDDSKIYTEEESTQIDEGLDLLREYFLDLWW